MKKSVHNIFSSKHFFGFALATMLSLGLFAQTVTIVPTGTTAKPNLIPVDNSVTFSINPISFGACMNYLSYSWAILNSNLDTVFKSTASSPNYNFTVKDIYTVTLTVKTIPGGPCGSNITKTATSVIKIAKEGNGANDAPKPNMFSSNSLGTNISAYNMDNLGQVISGPYDHFDPFPADNAITAALSMDNKGNFFYLPTFMSGSNPLTATPIAKHGVVEVWAVDKKGNNPPVVIASFDMNGSSNAELGLYRMGLDDKDNAWILAGDGTNMYATSFKTKGTGVVNTSEVTVVNVPFESGSASDFQSGDLAFDNNSNMYVLAGSSTGTYIYTMSTTSTTPTLSKKWRVTNAAGQNFGLSVTGTVFDALGNMFFSAIDGIYYINQAAVNPITGTAVVLKISENFGLMDLATSQFPTAWVPPFNGTPLAVKLIGFAGTATAEKVNLNWSVSGNQAGNYFEIQKSTNGVDFKTEAIVFTTEKEGTEAYNFADAATTGKVYYRLKMGGKNGTASYSNIVFFGGQIKGASTLTLLQNPVVSAVNFNYTASEKSVAEVNVYSAAGVKVLSQKHTIQKGTNSITVPLNMALLKGLYVLEVKDGSASQAVKFIKQ